MFFNLLKPIFYNLPSNTIPKPHPPLPLSLLPGRVTTAADFARAMNSMVRVAELLLYDPGEEIDQLEKHQICCDDSLGLVMYLQGGNCVAFTSKGPPLLRFSPDLFDWDDIPGVMFYSTDAAEDTDFQLPRCFRKWKYPFLAAATGDQKRQRVEHFPTGTPADVAHKVLSFLTQPSALTYAHSVSYTTATFTKASPITIPTPPRKSEKTATCTSSHPHGTSAPTLLMHCTCVAATPGQPAP